MKIQDLKILVIVPHGFWGIGDTIKEALANCRRAGATNLKRYVVYIVAKDTTLDPVWGGIQYKSDNAPKLIHEVGRRATALKDVFK